MFAYIPENLDLNSNKHRDKFYFILTSIFYGRICNKRKNSTSFIQLYSSFLKKIINGRYKDYLQYLLEMKIIETDNHYIKKKKSKAYRLTENYRCIKTKRIRIMDEKIISNYWNDKAEQNIKISESHHKYLLKCLEKIEIDYEAAKDFINQNVSNIEEYNSWHCSVDMIYNKNWFFVVDRTAGRVHNNVTNLSKNFRPFISFNNKKLVEIDISNCQPLLFNVLISRYLLDNTSVFNCGSYLPYVPQNSDLRLYKALTEKGKFYEYMMDKLNINEDRSIFKARLFSKVFYGRENDGVEMTLFKKFFPKVSEIISFYKKVNYKKLSVELQTVEAQIMINSVIPKLAKENIFALTIHDSILTIPDFVSSVKEIIMNEFKIKDLTPTLKIKY